WAPLVVLVAAAALIAPLSASADRIGDKRAEAQRVLAQIQELDSSLGKAVEAYDGATEKLRGIRAQLAVNHYEMKVARNNLSHAENRLAYRLRQLYMNGEGDSTLEVILGSKSLDDVISRLDTSNRVSSQDAQVVREVRHFRAEVTHRGVVLRKAHAAQK